MSKERNNFVLPGTVYWAHVRKKNELSNKFQLNLKVSDRDAKKLKELGVPVHSELKAGKQEDGSDNVLEGNFVVLKSDFEPDVVDSKKHKLPRSLDLGNGTKANIATHSFDWTFKKKKGTSLGLDGVQVLELVEFNRRTALDAFAEEDGYETIESAEEELEAPKKTDHSSKDEEQDEESPY